jgi:hypothetical protein
MSFASKRSMIGFFTRHSFTNRFANKLRPGSLTNPSAREDGFVRTSNITRFLAKCSTHGVPAEDLFHRDDLIEASTESITRVACTVLSLFRITEAAAAERPRVNPGGGSSSGCEPYGSSRATELTPDLALVCPISPPVAISTQKKRRSSPTSGLPTATDSGLDTFHKNLTSRPTAAESDRLSPLGMIPFPRLPTSSRSSSSRGAIYGNRDHLSGNHQAGSSASNRDRDPLIGLRSSASSARTSFSSLAASSARTSFSSLLDMYRYRTAPSLTEDLHQVVEEVESRFGGENKAPLRVASSAGMGRSNVTMAELAREEEAQEKEQERRRRIHLGKAKWPDDFLDSNQQNDHATALAEGFGTQSSLNHLSASPQQTSMAAPPRPDAERSDLLPAPITPRRPSHRARHHVDTAVLLPSSPRLSQESLRSPLVQFPRQVLGEDGARDDSPMHWPGTDDRPDADIGSMTDRLKVLRGRFMSDVDGASSCRRPRPNSFDIRGSKPDRLRSESMLNLGVATSNPNASDIYPRHPVDIRQTLVVKEEGKLAVQYVCQFGLCPRE